MKKLFNARIPVLLAIALVAGVLFGYLLVYLGISMLWIIAVVPVAAIIFILCAVFAKRSRILIILPILAAFIILGGALCGARLLNYSLKTLDDGATYTFSASVYEKGESAYGEYLILSGVKADGKNVGGKIIAYLTDGADGCEVGYKVTFTSSVSGYGLFTDGKLNYNVQDNIKYSVKIEDGISASYRFSLFGTIRSAVRKTLFDNCDGDVAAVAYAMLTGNTQGIENSSMQTFRYGGIAHIFAVSGLHIGIAYGILTFFFKKVRLNKYAAAAICIAAVIFYAGICGFTLSSVRAVIMCAVSAIAKLFHQKYDSFNALSLAVILILVISPVSLFSVGFQLSVCAVGGIILLSKQIARPLKKAPRFISSAVGVSLGAQFGTLPVMLAGFGYISGAGLLLNVIIVPILSIIFEVLFVSVTLCTILPFAAPFIIPYVTLPLQAVLSFLVGAGFEKALLYGFGGGLFGLFYLICVLAVSDKLNLKPIMRIGVFAGSLCLLCAYSLWQVYSTV
ncbi:MAG: ComEC/Rec2 family competence protein [Clostridia bacterium]|nr:ComEC/Rec2 family competence protein [Clostridia bacterium]